MGGAIALNVCRKCPELVAAAVLVAPMLGIPERSLPPAWQQSVLRGLACVVPGAAVLGTNASDPAQQYSDPARRAECVGDSLQYHGSMRLASAAACLETAQELSEALDEVESPFLCLAAGRDTVVDTDGPQRLMERSATPADQKKLTVFPDALHGLLCEPTATRSQVEAEIVSWVAKYAATAAATAAAGGN